MGYKGKDITMSKGLISVIVPVYKVEAYLNRCVNSIVNQSYPELEIILVDDGSPDNCPAMCDTWADRDSRIHVIHKENGGLSDARNAGMAQASGEYISFVDSDDWIAAEMLDNLLESIRKNESDIAACTVEMVWEDGSPNQLLTVQTNCVLNREEAQKALFEETLLKQPVWYKLYRKETIQGIPFEVGKQHEDVFWSYQAIGNANHVSLIDYIGYYYTQRTGSIMGEGYSLKRLDAMEAYEKRFRYMQANFPELVEKAKISIVENCIYHGQMALKYLSKNEKDEAFDYLNSIMVKYRVRRAEYANEKITHRIWFDMARVSLKTTCKVKNALGVGL